MSSTLTALQLSAAARTAGPSRGVGSGRSHRQLQAQLDRLHLQGLVHAGLGAAAEGRPSGRKEEDGGQNRHRSNVEIDVKWPT